MIGDGEAWLREAVEAAYQAASLYDLPRTTRAVVFQKASGVLLALEEDGVPVELVGPDGRFEWVVYRDGTFEASTVGRRVRIVRAFARYFAGAALEGPPWRISEAEQDRPTLDEYAALADFGTPA